ncbi:MAG: DUF6326 family protein, partial [Candidatus Kariarchaeaceae archaeon]
MTSRLEDVQIKLAALWVTVTLAYLYADVIYILDVIAGAATESPMTPIFLLGISIFLMIPIVMVFLSLILPTNVNRWANIILSILYIGVTLLVQLPTGVFEAYYYYIVFGILEIVIHVLIIWYAWTWPTQ